ncbi:hypothetical protein MMC30_006556 [Trapelia coarctata]|nr:hypothetical protein [Trapelia coarctata]
MTPSRPPRPGSPRRRAVTDINEPRIQLGSRSRSDSKLSIFSSWEQLPSPSSDLSARPSSRGTRSSGASVREGRPDSIAMFMTKGTKLLTKRKKSKLDLRPLKMAEWMVDTDDVTNSKHVQELSKRRKSKHSRATSAGYEYLLKKSISDPYNFQHLTHTGAQQAKALKCADQNELVSEFSAIRASQAPRAGLKGIKAETLHRPNRSIGTGSPMTSYDSPPMASISPTRSRGNWGEGNSGSIRYSRSVDSFTRVTSRSFSSPTPPLSPPGRRSSRMAMMLPPNRLSSPNGSPTGPNFRANIDDDLPSYYHSASSRHKSPSISEDVGFQFDLPGIAQAVTTPDDSAYTLGSNLRPSPSAVLADVPEEDEAFPWGRNSNTNLQAPAEMATIRHSKSFPNVDLSRKPSYSSTNQNGPKLPSVFSEEWGTASDPTLPGSGGQSEDIPVQLPRRMSTNNKPLGDSWEDDIDFCYEHAAEADSTFDWYNVSKETDKELSPAINQATIDRSSSVYEEPIASLNATTNGADAYLGQASRPSSYLSNYINLSRLTTSTIGSTTDSAMSSAVTVPGIVTPAELSCPSTASNSTATCPLSPSFLVPLDWGSRVTHEDTFHHNLTNSDASKHSFPAYGPLLERDTTRDYSPRNSGSPLSKCNSRDSTLPSRTPSINTSHGTNSSVGSLPELVHSKAGSERVAHAAESLADHIASLNVAENPAELKLMIEATRQNFIRRAEDSADEREQHAPASLPLVYPRQRSPSDSANRLLDTFGAGPVRPKLATVNSVDRMRSTSISTQPVGRSRLARASYSLFPVHNVDA